MKNEAKEKDTERRGTSELTRLLGTREILFRGQSVSCDTWHYGDYFRSVEFGETDHIIKDCGINFIVNSETVTQFIGVTDDDGNKVYGGDIVNVFEEWEFDGNEDMGNHLVVWGGNGYPAFTLKPGLGTEMNEISYLKIAADYNEKLAVVGNIFDNPELINE